VYLLLDPVLIALAINIAVSMMRQKIEAARTRICFIHCSALDQNLFGFYGLKKTSSDESEIMVSAVAVSSTWIA
jgi:hypothetical protein